MSTENTSAVGHDTLTRVLGQIRTEVTGLAAGFDEHGDNPHAWPHTAAVMQSVGRQLTVLGALFAASLAAYAEAHPTIEVPEDGPAVALLPEAQHREFWNVAGDLRFGDDDDPDAAIHAYAEVFEGEYGRPELDVRAVALDDEGAVMVLLYLAEQGPGAVVAVYIGGWGYDDSDRIAQTLAKHGITPGAPRFWPPVAPEMTFLNLPGLPNEVFDAFGRRPTATQQR